MRWSCSSSTIAMARRRLLATTYCTISPCEESPLLVRDFIRDALYHPSHGYFSLNSGAVGILPEPVPFNGLKGRRHYMQQLNELYRQNGISWFTPAELFKPWYGYALAKYILRIHSSNFPLQIFEIGGGTGTCAKNILDYVKNEAPLVYTDMHYVAVEISQALAKTQMQTVCMEKTHRSHFSVEHRDACNRPGWGEIDDHPCFVILLEVLDNQPHDLIYKENSSCPWLETCIKKRHDTSAFFEFHKPVNDPLIKRCIKIMESGKISIPSRLLSIKGLFHKLFPVPRKAWIPTACLQLLESLYCVRPNLALIISDFSVLPDVQIKGEQAPLVASKKDGVTVDLSSYLDMKGDADIFFPTDFQLLRQLDNHCYFSARDLSASEMAACKTPRQSLVVPFSKFMKQYADTSKTETKDGFNPLLDDYSNVQFFLTRGF